MSRRACCPQTLFLANESCSHHLSSQGRPGATQTAFGSARCAVMGSMGPDKQLRFCFLQSRDLHPGEGPETCKEGQFLPMFQLGQVGK